MGLFDKLRPGGSTPADPEPVRTPADADMEPGTLLAPVSGTVIALPDVPDPVFSGGVLGKGAAIEPAEGVLYAPLSGTVSVAMGHGMGIVGDDGTEALVHIGVDTVEMQGSGFAGLVEVGDHVGAGQPCIRFDRDAIRDAGHPDCVMLVVSNTVDMASVELVVQPGDRVDAGERFLRATRG